MLTCVYILADVGIVCAVRAYMMARPASLENSLALHRLNCVDRPSGFGDISVASLENMLRSSAAGKFAFFAYVPVLSSRLRAVCPFHLPWGCPDDSRLQ